MSRPVLARDVVAGIDDWEAFTQVGVDQPRKAGLNVDAQTVDFVTMIRRRNSKEPPDKGGWNAHFIFADGLYKANPAANAYLRGDGKSGAPGWADSRELESLRLAWLETTDLDAPKRICQQMQRQLWRDVPYIPVGHSVRSTAHRREIVDLPWGHPAFHGVRRV